MEDEEIIDIRSDCESVDGLWDSDSDAVSDNEYSEDNEQISSEDSENEIDESLKDRLEKLDGIWEKRSRSSENIPFTEDSGPNVPESVTSPLDIFYCLFTTEIIDILVVQTNLYLNQKQSTLDPVSKAEMLTFIGINILMGIKRLPSYKDYWSMNSQLNDPYISNLMSCNRFSFFLSHLHANDNDKEPKKGEAGYDKLYKIRPIIEKLNESFKNCFKPNQHQSVDESMVKYKGRSTMKQYNAAKPIKRGCKIWVRADMTGYVCEFQIYTGKSTNAKEKSLGFRVVRDLTRAIVGKFHRVYFDNFFTSIDLIVSLKADGILACGTVRPNRIGLPKKQMSDKKMVRGEMEYRTSYTGVRWLKRKDNRSVQFLSNFHDPSKPETVSRKLKDGSRILVPCSVMVSDYNQHMGYVDKADQLKSTYQISRKSKKWWPRLFWHLLDVAITNAYIIYVEKGNKNMTLKAFRLAIVDGLVGGIQPLKKSRKNLPKVLGPHKPQISVEKRRSGSAHLPVYNQDGKRRRCALRSNSAKERKSAWICSECKVALCLTSQKNCFQAYHS
ncbi:piggyBac transposable element-derived protein 4-like [Leptopilina boulardi]|uniref:piggyBac transposable element-derived protein 4-like n=1 Tax=Leptopilina boulardi TaxID=63433 RepID=UPI0021F6729A|nr:piggyBac transposable element-derived protein 4-like [Leptopilina boulardi]